jgi:hypothetical protein
MPTAREHLAVGVVNGVLYAVGGAVDFNGGARQTVEAYDPVTNTWTTKAPMPTARWLLAVGVVNGVLYAVGGETPGVLQTVEAYDPATNVWTTKAPMPTARTALAVGVVDGVLFAVGGSNGPVFETVEAYDPATNTWTAKAPMPTARRSLGVGVVNGVLYAVGGLNDTSGNLATNEAFTPEVTKITVAIDIKPGSFPNSINPRSKGVIPVAILTTDTFDATTVDPTTVRFGATGTEAAPVKAALRKRDVDKDGDTDMMLHFKTQATGIVCGDTSASLTGETFSGQMIQGSDSIKTAGCK